MEGREDSEEFQLRKVRGPYKRYLRPLAQHDTGDLASPAFKLPKTTAWRKKRLALNQVQPVCILPSLPTEGIDDDVTVSSASLEVESGSDHQGFEAADCSGLVEESQARTEDGDISRAYENRYDTDDTSDSDSDDGVSEPNAPSSSVLSVASNLDLEAGGDSLSEPNVPYADSFGALHSALQNDYGVCIGKGTNSRPGRNIEVTASAGEALQILLTVASKHNLSNQALLDTINGFNAMFSQDVLPKSQFGLDKLLFNPENFKYFFYCLKCEEYLQERDDKISELQCQNCGVVNPVRDLSLNNHFVMVDLKHQLELIFLEENLISNEELSSRYSSGENSLSDIYDGSMYRDFFKTHVENGCLGEIHISLSFCVDGSPLYKSSNTTVWPIVAIVNEIECPKARMKRMLLVGLWYGSKKPKMEVLLEQFSRSSKTNETEGLDISFKDRSRKVKIHSLCCCVDSGARGATQGVSQHNGTCACNWCYQNGIEVANATRYPILGNHFVQERSKELHRADCRKLVDALNNGATIDARLVLETRGVRSVTPLMIIPSFDVVKGMIVDYMHASTLGLAKAFLTTWLTNTDHAAYIGAPNSQRLLNAKLNKITRCVEMRKPPRPIDIANWKARELENWILFYSASVLEGILDDKFYKHWMLFVQSLHILLQTSISEEDLIVAEILMETFIRDTEKLYGVEQMSFNVHIHKHIVDNVRRWGPLWAVNAFCFESFLGSLKRKVHANKGIQNQINHSLSHQSAMKIIENSLSLSAKGQKFISTARSYKSRNSQPDVERNGLKLYCRRKENVMFTPEEKWLMSRQDIFSDSDRFEEFGKAKLAYPPCVIKIRQPTDTSRIRNDTFQLRNGKIVVIERILDVKNKSVTIAFAKNVHTQPYLPQLYRALARRNSTAVKLATHLEESLVSVSLDEIKTVCYRSVDARLGDVIIPLPNLYNNA